MPQALEIVIPVIEEFEDGMDIDSGNGPDSNDTLAACVQCLLQCLNPATAGSGEGQLPYGNPLASAQLSLTTVLGGYIQQVIGPLDQALTHGGRQVVSTVYQELQAFFLRLDRWTAPGEQVLAGPMNDLAILLTQDRNAVEVVRKGRAEAILVYLKLRPVVRDVPDSFGDMLRGWRASERSNTVQRILDEAQALM
jgi:proteasome component ECM29